MHQMGCYIKFTLITSALLFCDGKNERARAGDSRKTGEKSYTEREETSKDALDFLMESPETEMLVGNEVGKGGKQDPSADKKAWSDTCKKKKAVTGQEHLYSEWTGRRCEPKAGNIF